MKKETASILTLAALVIAAGTPAQAQEACHHTSVAARKACRNEARDDFWIEVGICRNISNASGGTDAQKECIADAHASRTETVEECVDQFGAREDLCDALGQSPYDPILDPGNFLSAAEIDANPNPYFPLVSGATWVYEGDGETITVTVTGDTKEILGIEAVVVNDVAEEDGEIVEDTDDWYGQDVFGNVWYLGEISKNYEDGELVDIEGSWTAGVDGAKAGILMKAAPMVGDVYRQEWALGDAEDAAEVLSLTASAVVPAAGASCAGTCVETLDFTPIEPDVAEEKYYSPGVGLILEVDRETGERVELTAYDIP